LAIWEIWQCNSIKKQDIQSHTPRWWKKQAQVDNVGLLVLVLVIREGEAEVQVAQQTLDGGH